MCPTSSSSSASSSSSSLSSPLFVRCSESQLRRAAGSQSLETLQRAIQGWTVSELDALPMKNPVHMAAWKGSLDNLKFLLLKVGCNVNAISTAEFSYGKTAIFFALTQSRADVVEFLLELQPECNLKIVNNKGQTPLSIASSHLSPDLVTRLAQKEALQTQYEWTNYRATHSDGNVYGDLDGRFLERNVCDTDVVTPYAVNPTTKAIRKGNFLRNNPHKAAVAASSNSNNNNNETTHTTKNKLSKPKAVVSTLSRDDLLALDAAWVRMENALRDGMLPIPADMWNLLRWNVQRRQSWIPQSAERLRALARENGGTDILTRLFDKAMDTASATADERNLLIRLRTHTLDPYHGVRASLWTEKLSTGKTEAREALTDPKWAKALQHVHGLSMHDLQGSGAVYLTLQNLPRFVDTITGLKELESRLLVSGQALVSVDAEWHDDGGLSTFQVAVRDESWVLDLLPSDPSYVDKCRELLQRLFAETPCVLGFSLDHDLSKIEDYLQEPLSANSRAHCLDLQKLYQGKELPGLKQCVADFGFALSKKEQCSDWSRRPLSPDQLAYAGLDAAILAYLLNQRRLGLMKEASNL